MFKRSERQVEIDLDEGVARFYRQRGIESLTSEEAIETIKRGLNKYFFKPQACWPLGYHRYLRVYTRGMAFEIINMLRQNEAEDPIRLIVALIDDLEEAWLESDGEPLSYFFYYNYEAAKEILNIL